MKNRAVFIEGPGINLCTAVADDFGPTMAKWINDKEVTQYLSRGTQPAQLDALAAEYAALKDANKEIQLAIVDKESETYIGIVGLHSLNWISKHAEFRILIGEKKFWGKGFGTEACQLITAYGFEALNFNKVWLGVNTVNERAFKSYLKAGFKEEGVLRQELYRNGRYFDIARMSILRDEYLTAVNSWPTEKWIKKQFSAPA